MKFIPLKIFSITIVLLLIIACKPKNWAQSNTSSNEPKQKAENKIDPATPHILYCQLMFYKANPVPTVSVLSTEAVAGTLNFSPNNNGTIHYQFMDNNEKILAEGSMNNPLYFNAADKDPSTGIMTGRLIYRDSAFKSIRIPYIEGISKLKILFTDSLNNEHLLKLTPLTITKS